MIGFESPGDCQEPVHFTALSGSPRTHLPARPDTPQPFLSTKTLRQTNVFDATRAFRFDESIWYRSDNKDATGIPRRIAPTCNRQL